MKSTLIKSLVVGVMLSSMSHQVLAYGGGSGGTLGGSPSVAKEQLEAKWNGKAGPQATPISGIIAHWKADACGTLNGIEFDSTKCDNTDENKETSLRNTEMNQ